MGKCDDERGNEMMETLWPAHGLLNSARKRMVERWRGIGSWDMRPPASSAYMYILHEAPPCRGLSWVLLFFVALICSGSLDFCGWGRCGELDGRRAPAPASKHTDINEYGEGRGVKLGGSHTSDATRWEWNEMGGNREGKRTEMERRARHRRE